MIWLSRVIFLLLLSPGEGHTRKTRSEVVIRNPYPVDPHGIQIMSSEQVSRAVETDRGTVFDGPEWDGTVFRGDARTPPEIKAKDGFYPRPGPDAASKYSIYSHVKGNIQNTGYVSTTSDVNRAGLYAGNSLKAPGHEGKTVSYVYQIQANKKNYVGVNKSLRLYNVWSNQEHVAMDGIPWSAVKGYAKLTMEQLDSIRASEAKVEDFVTSYTPNEDFIESSLPGSSARPELAGWPEDSTAWRVEPWRGQRARNGGEPPNTKQAFDKIKAACRGLAKRDGPCLGNPSEEERFEGTMSNEDFGRAHGTADGSKAELEGTKDVVTTEEVAETASTAEASEESQGILEELEEETTRELDTVAEKFAEEQFAALSVRYRLANVKTRQWSVSPLELRKRLQGYKRLRATTKFKPGKPVTLAGGGLGAVAEVVGFGIWVDDVVRTFHAEVSDWDKAAALFAILPLVGCQVQAAAAEERGQLDSLDHGLCVFADGLMMTGIGLIPGLAMQAFRSIRNTLLGKQLPSANDLLRLRDQKWQDHLGSMNKSLFSEDFASLVEADFMIEMSTALFEATTALGRLQAGEQVALKAGRNTEQVQAIQAGMLEIRRQFLKGVNQRKAELRTNLPRRMKKDLEAQANNFNEKFIEALKLEGYNGYEKKEGGDWTPLVDLKQVESIVQELRRSPLQTPDLEIITTLVHQRLDPLAVPSLATEYQGDREIYHIGGPSDSGDRWQDSPWRDSSPPVSPGPLVTFCVDAARCVQVRIRFGTCDLHKDTFGFFDHDFHGTISSFSLDRSASTCRLYRDSNCAGLHLTTSHPYNELPSRGPEFGNVVNSFSCSSNEPPSANPPAERVKDNDRDSEEESTVAKPVQPALKPSEEGQTCSFEDRNKCSGVEFCIHPYYKGCRRVEGSLGDCSNLPPGSGNPVSSFHVDKSNLCTLDFNCVGRSLTVSTDYKDLTSQRPEFGDVVKSFRCRKTEPQPSFSGSRDGPGPE
ncbi:Heat-labile enterotoxin, A chain [Beauveria brongniartii RCEF 3172]|uniref:Heat-labile enterotoxin, A chain n=1 Tax=Beauveria brongniartii RCEF 3172 TaxID=1081107 RepID=A0A166RU10_9HYPO|nr:Heat-labile enterotoxin, A chain [Beauveria brongniartii RCEF 3172]